MKTRHLPRLPGVYRIRNVVNNKSYLGSSVDIQVRAHQHKRALNEGHHPNKVLQRAWRKYGYVSFEASVVELVEPPQVLTEREQYWLDRENAAKCGYNIRSQATTNKGIKWSEDSCALASRVKSKPHPGFISPEGAEVAILNMRSFCEQHGLTRANMSALAHGKATSHKGWTHVNARPKKREPIKTYEGFIDPEGNPVGPITNMRQFCQQHGLDASAMHVVHRGKKPSHHGWTHVDSVNRQREPTHVATYHGFVNPEGERVTITNLTKLCRDNRLDHATMWRVLQGKLPQHKGWTYSPP